MPVIVRGGEPLRSSDIRSSASFRHRHTTGRLHDKRSLQPKPITPPT